MMASTLPSSPRFASILACRPDNARPSLLEIALRPHCRKLKVVSHLAGQAHLVLPMPGDAGTTSSLAIRVYYQETVVQMQQQQQQQAAATATTGDDDDDDNVDDNIAKFQASFANTIVLFVLTPEQRMQQLKNYNSFLMRAQRRLGRAVINATHNKQTVCPSIVLLADNTDQALDQLWQILACWNPQRQILKKELYARTGAQQFLPVVSSNNQLGVDATRNGAAANCVRGALLELCTKFELPPDEIGLLLNDVATLQNMTTIALDQLPLDPRTKQVLGWMLQNDGGRMPASCASATANLGNNVVNAINVDNDRGIASTPEAQPPTPYYHDYPTVEPAQYDDVYENELSQQHWDAAANSGELMLDMGSPPPPPPSDAWEHNHEYLDHDNEFHMPPPPPSAMMPTTPRYGFPPNRAPPPSTPWHQHRQMLPPLPSSPWQQARHGPPPPSTPWHHGGSQTPRPALPSTPAWPHHQYTTPAPTRPAYVATSYYAPGQQYPSSTAATNTATTPSYYANRPMPPPPPASTGLHNYRTPGPRRAAAAAAAMPGGSSTVSSLRSQRTQEARHMMQRFM